MTDLVEHVAKSEWQPIATAPKDWTNILFFADEDIGICWWDVDAGAWKSAYRDEYPTHWQPLPEPPESAE